jgi:dTMP kinase
MFIDFEGIDGSGKTTLSNRVAERLRAKGLEVVHARAGGELPCVVSRKIRSMTRDASDPRMAPETELLLNAAREAQVLAEVIRPALARGAVVIADRSLDSHLAMAQARGIPEERARAVLDAVADGGWADLVVLVDVDPDIARLRKRASRLEAKREEPPGRKGLSGQALLLRMRSALHRAAECEPNRFVVVRNEEADLETLERRIVEAVEQKLATAEPRNVAVVQRRLPPVPLAEPAPLQTTDPAELEALLVERVRRWMAADPTCAAMLLSGVDGAQAMELRRELAARAPAAVASSLGSLPGAGIELLEQLVDAAPRSVALALALRKDARAEALRLRLADVRPAEIAMGLLGRQDAAGWELRERLWAAAPDAVLASLAGDDGAAAWTLRSRARTAEVSPEAILPSLAGLDSERAWAWRGELEATVPALLRSIRGCVTPQAWELRKRWLEVAPRPVLKGMLGLDDDLAWELRWRAGAGSGEVLDSVMGMRGPRPHALRAELAPFFPARALASLPPERDEKEDALLREIVSRFGGHLLVLRAALRAMAGNGAVQEEEAA